MMISYDSVYAEVREFYDEGYKFSKARKLLRSTQKR